jgi:hypothetical protein
MIRNFIFFILLFFAFISCQENDHLTAEKEKVIIEEIKIMMNDYYNDIKTNGLLAEFKYLDSSKEFFWTPPGYSTIIRYDSVANILRSNAAGFKSIENTWDTLDIMPASERLVFYTASITSRVTDTSGKITLTKLFETGAVIKRKDGWKLLSGETSIHPQTDEPVKK